MSLIEERFVMLRKHLGLNQTEMGVALVSSQAHISRIENGQMQPTAQDKEILKLKYHVNIKWLEDGEGEMFVIADNSNSDEYMFTRLRLLMSEISYLLDLRTKK